MDNPTSKMIIEQARRQYASEGTLEFDDTPKISRCPDGDGAYVAAWVWVYYEDIKCAS